MRKLKELRRERGWSQARLAGRAELDPSTINQIERGVREASPGTLRKLAEALEVSLYNLLEDDSPKAQAPRLPLDDPADETNGADGWAESYTELGERLIKRWRRDITGWDSVHKSVLRHKANEGTLIKLMRTSYWRWALGVEESILEYMEVAAEGLEHSLASRKRVTEVCNDMARLYKEISEEARALLPPSEEDHDAEVEEFRKQLDELNKPGEIETLVEKFAPK